ncbi:sarcosine oxidase subunit delta [Pelagibacterales bacterium]|nr:sarcosine oxidase subunit delta [Pelagibacterales bacterium]
MLEIKCPYCGERSQNEFSYGGDATINRPKLNTDISDLEWDSFVYYRNNPRGKHLELWHHISGCRQWFKVHRNTATHEIIKTLEMQEDLQD